MGNVIWPETADALAKYLVKKKKTYPMFEAYIKMIHAIPEKTKERVLRLYLARQNILHTVRFLLHRLKFLSNSEVSIQS
jgi:ubiquinone biosynthesis protein COQ9